MARRDRRHGSGRTSPSAVGPTPAVVWHLALEIDVDALIGLNAHRQTVALQRRARRQGEHQMRRTTKLNDHLAESLIQRLSGAQKEWYAVPAPVIDGQLDGGKCRRARVGGHASLAAIAGVLAAHHTAEPLLPADKSGIASSTLTFSLRSVIGGVSATALPSPPASTVAVDGFGTYRAERRPCRSNRRALRSCTFSATVICT